MTTGTPEYRFLKDIAADLSSGDVSFPTFLDATLKVRMALQSPKLTADELARVVVSEPLLSVKVIRLANSAALNSTGKPVTDVKSAVIRVGFSSVRTLAIVVAMDQLLHAKDLKPFLPQAKALWEHSIEVAALSFVIAKWLTRLNPHEAMFAGLVHDIGQFYLLSRAVKRTNLAYCGGELGRLMFEWHASVGHAVLNALGVPEEIVKAVDDHELAYEGKEPKTLAQVVHLANQVAERRNPFVSEVDDGEARPTATTGAQYMLREILEEANAERDSILAVLRM